MDATNRTLSESRLLPAAIAMTVTDLMAAGLMIVTAVLLTGKNTLIPCHSYSVASPELSNHICNFVFHYYRVDAYFNG
jgi:hypothetical protein